MPYLEDVLYTLCILEELILISIKNIFYLSKKKSLQYLVYLIVRGSLNGLDTFNLLVDGCLSGEIGLLLNLV